MVPAGRAPVRRRMFKSKLHRGTVTHADLDYEGSFSIPRDLMEAADILPFEAVDVWNVTRGTRLTTYAIEVPAGSAILCANGAAAHLIKPGDLVIIATFTEMDEVPPDYLPVVVRLDANNRIVDVTPERAGPQGPT
jgi:aspartate 1-decarboxylase